MSAAVVTGAAGGLGSAVARLLAEHGPVVLLDRDADAVHALAAELRATAIVADVSDADAVDAAARGPASAPCSSTTRPSTRGRRSTSTRSSCGTRSWP